MAPVPKRLYKYRPFHTNSVIEIERNVVYYANPKDFNDPLDCSPVVEFDISIELLEALCLEILIQRQGKNVDTELAKSKAMKVLNRHRDNATEPYEDGSVDVERRYLFYIRHEVQSLLEGNMARQGVLSLAQKWDCPLMWSHYADQHRGICIEYDSSCSDFASFQAVDYSGNRNIKASDLYGFYVENLAAARKRVMDCYFYRKAPQWRYEKEWRDVRGGSSVSPSPYLISGIYFGIRCESSVESMIVKLFQGAEHEPKFYCIREDIKTFKLRRYLADIEDLLYESPGISEEWRIKKLAGMLEDETQKA